MVKDGKFTLLLTSHGEEWQFHIAADIYVVKNGNFTLLLTSSVQNGNFILLLTSSGQEWQLADLPADLPLPQD